MSPLITNVSQRFEKDMRLQIKYVITPTNATPATYRPKFIKNPLKYFLSNTVVKDYVRAMAYLQTRLQTQLKEEYHKSPKKLTIRRLRQRFVSATTSGRNLSSCQIPEASL